ncbi:MAG TPA: ATP-binding protein, partial [Actinoplanes sp.]|nr:ATP-binding protein [Actinoplanes sp.]
MFRNWSPIEDLLVIGTILPVTGILLAGVWAWPWLWRLGQDRWARHERRTRMRRQGRGGESRLLRDVPAGDRPYLVPTELPPVPATFVGRGDELEAITEHLARTDGERPRIVLISGPDGIGKTTLAVVAITSLVDRYPGGHLFADLGTWAGTSGERDEPDRIVDRVLGAFIVALKGPNDVVRDGAHRPQQYQSLCRNKPVAIVVDGADDLSVVHRLLPDSPDCAVIVTTSARNPEHPPEWLGITLAPLSQQHSLALLRTILPTGWTTHDDTAIRVVSRLAGHPNAIRLAATQLALRADCGLAVLGRIGDDPAAELAARRAERLARTADTHGYSPAPGLRVSFGLLGEDEQTALRLIGMLESPRFSRWTLTVMLDWDDARAARVLDRLLVAGFVSRSNVDLTGLPSFRVSPDVHAFARERFKEASRPLDRRVLRGRYESQSAQQDADAGGRSEQTLRLLAAGRTAEALESARRAAESVRRASAAPEAASEALSVLAEIHAELGAFQPAADQAKAV